MSNNVNYTQCYLRKGEKYDVLWIPTKFARVGNVIDIKDYHGFLSVGWTVLEVYSTVPYERLATLYSAREAFKSKVH